MVSARSCAVVDRREKARVQRGVVHVGDRLQFQAVGRFAEHRHADLSAAVGDHEIDNLRRDCFGGADEIAFILAVHSIDDDNHFAATDRVNSRLNSGKTVRQGKTWGGGVGVMFVELLRL